MQRYLIHHGDDGTWDLVVGGEAWTVEHVLESKRERFTVEDFQKSPDGERLAAKLTDALARAMKTLH